MADLPEGLPPVLSLAGLCFLLDVGKMRVSQLVSEGIIERGPERGTYTTESVRRFVQETRRRGEGPASWNAARTELARERVAKAKLDRQEREAELLPKSDVIAMGTAIASVVRNRLLLVPTKFAARLCNIGKPAEVERVLRGAVEEALEGLAGLKVVPTAPNELRRRRRAG